MATLSLPPLSPQLINRSKSQTFTSFSTHGHPNFINLPSISRNSTKSHLRRRSNFAEEEESESPNSSYTFEGAVDLFNNREYYACHDVLESLWFNSSDETRTLFHGLLQCSVGFHHLFNQNHKGAMMELGEGLCKLRKLGFERGPLQEFEREISDVLEFIYRTQLELAACNEDLCIAMEQTERSYQLLGSFAAKERIYNIESNEDGSAYIVFNPARSYGGTSLPSRTRLPKLQVNREHLKTLSI